MLSRDFVQWAYRLYLDREPESEAVLDSVDGQFSDTKEMRLHFMGSEEYAKANALEGRFCYLGHMPEMDVALDPDPACQKRIHEHVRATWERFGNDEPYWSVYSNERFKKNSLAENLDAFWKSGEGSAQLLVDSLRRNDIAIEGLNSCLEYGCGVGRVTRPLSKLFASVEAFDISRAHIDIAEKGFRENGIENVNLHNIASLDDLESLPKVDVVFSVIVLQHNPPPVIATIYRKLLGALNPGGVAFVQIPTYRKGYSFDPETYLESNFKEGELEMHYLPQRAIFEIAFDAGCVVVEVIEDYFTGRPPNELSNTIMVRKR